MITSDQSQLWSEKVLAAQLQPFLSRSDNIFDIGAGSCNLTYLLKKRGYNVTPIDVVDHNKTALPLRLFDGKGLPYKTHEFDVGLLVFVLHHASNHKELIRESARVVKKLIVIEDTPGNLLERVGWRVIDYILNHAHHKDIAIAHRAQTSEDWQRALSKLGFRTTSVKTFRSVFTTLGAYRHTLFVL